MQFKSFEMILKQTFSPKIAKIAQKLNKISPKMVRIIHIWSKWLHMREIWSKSYCQSKILLATRLLGFTTFCQAVGHTKNCLLFMINQDYTFF